MRKVAGFLLFLLLGTLVVITTSFGYEITTSSHPAHLTAPYGQQIATCGDCHPSSSDCTDVGIHIHAVMVLT